MAFASGNEDVYVSDMGTVQFSFTIQFSQAGPLGYHEQVTKFELYDDGRRRIVECLTVQQASIQCSFMNSNDHQWWTVANDSIRNVSLILHQAKSTDRRGYTAQIEGVDPASNSIIDQIQKEISVIGNFL